jgi:hypothetical protein
MPHFLTQVAYNEQAWHLSFRRRRLQVRQNHSSHGSRRRSGRSPEGCKFRLSRSDEWKNDHGIANELCNRRERQNRGHSELVGMPFLF